MDLLSEGVEEDQVPVSPDVRAEVESGLKTYDDDKKTALPWRDGLRQLTPWSSLLYGFNDVAHAGDWYEKQRLGLGADFALQGREIMGYD